MPALLEEKQCNSVHTVLVRKRESAVAKIVQRVCTLLVGGGAQS